MQSVVVYTPQENFWYNSDLGPVLLLWFFSLLAAAFIVGTTMERKKPWQITVVGACVTYTIHFIVNWLLVHA